MLLVDPHEDSRTIYSAILEHHGYAVVTAPSYEAGLRAMGDARPALVVMAFVPPRTRSMDAVRALRAHPGCCDAPMLILSTTLGDHDRDVLLAEGIAAYIVKPCPPLALLAEVRRILGN